MFVIVIFSKIKIFGGPPKSIFYFLWAVPNAFWGVPDPPAPPQFEHWSLS